MALGLALWNRHGCDYRLLDRARAQRRPGLLEPAPGDQCRRRAGLDHAAQYLGRSLAGEKAVDCRAASRRRTGHADAARSGRVDALGIPGLAHWVLAVVPDAVLHGCGQPLPVSGHGGSINFWLPYPPP